MSENARTDNLNLDRRGKPRVQTVNDLPSLTVQSDQKAADINEILYSAAGIGVGEHLRDVELRYMDVSEFTDFSDMMRQMRIAEAEFMSLPSKVREKFNHDVAEWLDAAHESPEVRDALATEVGESSTAVAAEGATGGDGGVETPS